MIEKLYLFTVLFENQIRCLLFKLSSLIQNIYASGAYKAVEREKTGKSEEKFSLTFILFCSSLIIFILDWENSYLLLSNGLASFFEGAFGFGGSLIFLALNIHHLGWGESILLDCILASINLSYVAWLNRKEFIWKDISYLMTQYLFAIVGLSLGIFYFIFISNDIFRVLPFLLFGIFSNLYKFQHQQKKKQKKPFRRVQNTLLAGFGLGSCNLEAPFTDKAFRGKTGLIAGFLVILLCTKITYLLTSSVTPIEIEIKTILYTALFSFFFTKIGFIFYEELNKGFYSSELIEMIKRWVVRVCLIILILSTLL